MLTHLSAHINSRDYAREENEIFITLIRKTHNDEKTHMRESESVKGRS